MFDTGINAGDVYRHFKGNRYEIVTLAQDAEDGSLQVVYKALYPPYLTFVRPYAEFIEELDRTKYPSATQVHRFERGLRNRVRRKRCVRRVPAE